MYRVSDRKPYNGDLSDAQWDLIRPVITAGKAVVVTAASVTDNVIGKKLLDKVAVAAPTVTKAWMPAFEREGAFLRAFVERFEEPARTHHCVELWPSRWRPGQTRRIGPGGSARRCEVQAFGAV